MTETDVQPEEFPEPGDEQKGGVLGHDSPIREEEVRRRAVLEQKQFITGRISESVRYIGFGLLVAYYTLVTSDTDFSRRVVALMPQFLKSVGLLGLLAVIFDYFQYLAGNFAVRSALKVEGANAFMYNRKWWSYRLRGVFYVLKQIAVAGGAAALVAIVIMAN